MKILILISITILAVGCGEKSTVKHVGKVKSELKGVTKKELENREGIDYLKGSDTPYTGKVFALYENGKKKQDGSLKDGKMDGLWVAWHENGKKAVEGNFKEGKQYGYM